METARREREVGLPVGDLCRAITDAARKLRLLRDHVQGYLRGVDPFLGLMEDFDDEDAYAASPALGRSNMPGCEASWSVGGGVADATDSLDSGASTDSDSDSDCSRGAESDGEADADDELLIYPDEGQPLPPEAADCLLSAVKGLHNPQCAALPTYGHFAAWQSERAAGDAWVPAASLALRCHHPCPHPSLCHLYLLCTFTLQGW